MGRHILGILFKSVLGAIVFIVLMFPITAYVYYTSGIDTALSALLGMYVFGFVASFMFLVIE